VVRIPAREAHPQQLSDESRIFGHECRRGGIERLCGFADAGRIRRAAHAGPVPRAHASANIPAVAGREVAVPMLSAAMPSSVWRRGRALLRVRAWISGLGYLALLNVGLAVAWSLQYTVWGALYGDGHADAEGMLRDFAISAIDLLAGMLPAAPVIVLLLNLAPAAGPRRYALMAAIVVFMVSCFQAYQLFAHGTWMSASEVAESLLTTSVILAACAYRSSARDAADILLHRRIAGATLDAEVTQARLRFLRAQIEPHFLFNTLATVRTLARVDRAAAVRMLENLMRYLSEALPRLRQDYCTLAEEFELVEAYLRIHQVRMGARLNFDVALPAELADVHVPTMMLLTLVENAVKHAVNPAVEGGWIRVSAARERDAIVLRVEDSGPGIAAAHGHGTGLANVRLRLAMACGEGAALSLAPSEPHGMVAAISIPQRVRA
jgi:signal transduction histidine kinase